MKDFKNIKVGTIIAMDSATEPLALLKVTKVTSTEFTAGRFRFMKSTGKLRGALSEVYSAHIVSPKEAKAIKAEALRRETKAKTIQALEAILSDYKSEDLTAEQKAKVHSFIKEF